MFASCACFQVVLCREDVWVGLQPFIQVKNLGTTIVYLNLNKREYPDMDKHFNFTNNTKSSTGILTLAGVRWCEYFHTPIYRHN